MLVADIILNELQHARTKLPAFAGRVDYIEENATAMTLADGSVDANVIFFLLHELPHELKGEALREACRVLAPGGKLYLAEFHRPEPWVLRAELDLLQGVRTARPGLVGYARSGQAAAGHGRVQLRASHRFLRQLPGDRGHAERTAITGPAQTHPRGWCCACSDFSRSRATWV